MKAAAERRRLALSEPFDQTSLRMRWAMLAGVCWSFPSRVEPRTDTADGDALLARGWGEDLAAGEPRATV